MASPFDRRIINQLERPTSQDLNEMQSYQELSHQQMLRYTVAGSDIASHFIGALGTSFRTYANSGDLIIHAGIGSSGGPSAGNSDIDGVLGLNTPANYNLISAYGGGAGFNGIAGRYLRIPKENILGGLAAGTCRKVVIAIRRIYGDDGLTDLTATDIYDPGSEAFAAANRYKRYSEDIFNTAIEYNDEGDTPNSPIVCIKGNAAPYSSAASFEGITPPVAGSPYINIAVVNVYYGQTAINPSDVVDYRRLIATNNKLTFYGSATIGSSGGVPGSALSVDYGQSPSGITWAISKLGQYTGLSQNLYRLWLFGPRNIGRVVPMFNVTLPYPVNPFPSVSYPFSYVVNVVPQYVSSLTSLLTYAQFQLVSNASYTRGPGDFTANYAPVGQPCAYIDFSLVVAGQYSGITYFANDYTAFGRDPYGAYINTVNMNFSVDMRLESNPSNP